MLLERTELLLAPALTHADEHGKDPFDSTRLVPEMRNDLRPSSFLFKGAFRQVRRAHILTMARRDLEVVATRDRILLQAPTRFRKGILILRQQRLPATLPFRKRRRIPHVRHQRFDGGPGLRGHVLVQILHHMKPAAHPERPRPPGGLEPTLDQLPPHLEATLLALTVGGRQRE